MNISGVGAEASIQALQGMDNKKAQLQAMLLRKSLDAQQEQGAEMMKMLEGKGQSIDIRV